MARWGATPSGTPARPCGPDSPRAPHASAVSASRSRASSSAKASSAVSAPSPSAWMVTVSPPRAPSASTARMLAASTGLPSPLLISTRTGWLAAAFTTIAAGRPCSPIRDPITTSWLGMASLLRLDGDLDRLARGHDADRVEHLGQRQPVGDQVVHRHPARGDQVERLLVVCRAGSAGAHYGQLPVVHPVGVE